jgi:hypothetical protein
MKDCLDEVTLQIYFDGELSGLAAERVASHLSACVSCSAVAREIQNEMSLLESALRPALAVNVPTENLRQRIEAAIAESQLATPVPAYAKPVTSRSMFSWFTDLFAGFPRQGLSYAAVTAIVVAFLVVGVTYFKRGAVKPGSQLAHNQPPAQTVNPTSSPVASTPTNSEPSTVRTPDVAINKTPVRSVIHRRAAPETETTAALLPGEQNYIKTIAALDATIKSHGQPMRPGLQVEYQHNLAVVDQAIATTRAAAQKNPKDPDAAQFVLSAYQSKVELMTQIADSRSNSSRE